jgi:hypothetical protein
VFAVLIVGKVSKRLTAAQLIPGRTFQQSHEVRPRGADVRERPSLLKFAGYSRVTGLAHRSDNQSGPAIMGPQNQIILDDDVLEAVKQCAEAEGKTLDQATNDVVRLGLSEARWQRVLKRGRDYRREMMGAVSDEEAIQVAVDAVHESRAERRGR